MSFLASPNQKFIASPIAKSVGWSVCSLSILVSWWMLSQHHNGVIAAVIVLVAMMVMWLAIIFSHAHVSKKFVPFCAAGAILFGLLASLGGL